MPSSLDSARRPWNLGRLIGHKPPFKPKHIWTIRTRLQHEGRSRDLALFNTAIDSKLRDCDLVRLRVADVHLGAASACEPLPSSRRLAVPSRSS